MKRFILFMSMFFAQVGLLQAQGDEENIRKNSTELIFRGKSFVMVFVEDEWARGISAGTEIVFNKRFSIVADYVNYRSIHEREVPIEPGDYSNYNEYSQRDTKNYLAFELRYLPSFLQFDMWKIYLNTYSKVGARFLDTDDLYPLNYPEVIRINSSFHDFGSSLGVRFGIWWGLDVNIGAAYRNETKSEDTYHLNGNTTYTKDINDARWVPNIRASLYFNISEKIRESKVQD